MISVSDLDFGIFEQVRLEIGCWLCGWGFVSFWLACVYVARLNVGVKL